MSLDFKYSPQSPEPRRVVTSVSVSVPPLSSNEELRLYLSTNQRPRPPLYRPFPFPLPHPRLAPPLLPPWPGFPLSGRKRRHRTIFTEGQLREVSLWVIPNPTSLE